MAHPNSILASILSVAAPIAQTVILVQAARRKLLHEYWVFVAYTVFQILKIGLYPIIHTHPLIYFVAYWTGEVVDIPLVIAVLYQLYSSVFRGFEALRYLQDLLFQWTTAICALVAVTTAAATSGGNMNRVLAGVLALDMAAAVVKVGLVIFLLLMSSVLSLRWPQYAFGILVGMALYNSVVLATVAAREQFGNLAHVPYAMIKVAAYNCAVFVWLLYFVEREPVPQWANSVPANDLASWNEALRELLTK